MALARRKKGNDIHGWLVIDKDLNQTSTDVVNKVRRILNANKAGHAGTLDPLASGILPIALGEATRTVPFLMEAEKTYKFTIKWGSSTTTQDAEGQIVATSEVRPTQEQIKEKLSNFIGEISQIPPKYSAIKVDGERAYDLARTGEEFELKPRQVLCLEFEITSHELSQTSFFVRCGKGFYIRALARDLAKSLGAEGHIIYLRRTSVGPFKENAAITLENLREKCIEAPALQLLLPFETALEDIPVLAIKEPEVIDLRMGRKILILPAIMAELKEKRRTKIVGDIDMSYAVVAKFNGQAIAIGNARGGHFAPFRVFQT